MFKVKILQLVYKHFISDKMYVIQISHEYGHKICFYVQSSVIFHTGVLRKNFIAQLLVMKS